MTNLPPPDPNISTREAMDRYTLMMRAGLKATDSNVERACYQWPTPNPDPQRGMQMGCRVYVTRT